METSLDFNSIQFWVSFENGGEPDYILEKYYIHETKTVRLFIK